MSKVKATQLTSQLKAPHNFPGQNNYITIINDTKLKFTLLQTLQEIKKESLRFEEKPLIFIKLVLDVSINTVNVQNHIINESIIIYD